MDPSLGETRVVSTYEAANELKIHNLILTFIADMILKIPREQIGATRSIARSDVVKIDEYIKSIDPEGRSRTRGKSSRKRSRRRSSRRS